MNEPLVIQFQAMAMAMNNETPIASLLRMAKTIAVKLDLKDVDDWMTCELNGYTRNASVPDYRIVRCKLKGIHNLFCRSVCKINTTAVGTLPERVCLFVAPASCAG